MENLMAYRDPDDILVVSFKYQAFENPNKSLAEGRPIFDDVEICEIRAPGSKDVRVFPANEFCRWLDDPYTGQQRKQSYAERFSHQYRQFKASSAQTKTGTPLEHAPFLSDGRRAELRAQNVYTIEQLAAIEGSELKNLGPGGREFKNKAMEFIEQSRVGAPNKQMLAELEALRARNAVLEEDVIAIKSKREVDEAEFEPMTIEQLREYITTNTGRGVIGQPSRKNLVRMAMECRPERVA
jgi:hypothetical protein